MMEKLPPGWTLAAIGKLCKVDNGRAFKSSEWRKDGLPIIRIQNLKNPEAGFNRFDGDLKQQHRVKQGDLLFAWSGTPGTSFGAHIWRGTKAALNQHIFKVTPRLPALDKQYLRAALNWNVVRYIQEAQGGVGLAHITKRKFLASGILLAPADEQRRIVEALDFYLSRLEAATQALKRVEANLKRYRASVLQAAVEGRLVPTEAELARAEGRDYEPASALLQRILAERRRRWEEAELAKMKAKGTVPKNDRWKAKYKEPVPPGTSELPELPEGWCWATVEQLTSSIRGGTSETASDQPTPRKVLRSSAVRQGYVDLSDTRFLSHEAPRRPKNKIKPGSLLITRLSGSLEYVANCAVVPSLGQDEIEFPDRLFQAQSLSLVCTKFIELCFAVKSLRTTLETSAKSSAGHQRVSLSDVRSFRIPLPPHEEQERIARTFAEKLSLIESTADLAANSIARAQALRQAILKWAFEGKLVDQDPNDEPAEVLLERIRLEQESSGRSRRKRRATK